MCKFDSHQESEKMIRACPTTPNCISSMDIDRQHSFEPLSFVGSAQKAQHQMLDVLSSLKRTRVVSFKGQYIRAEAVSAVMRFVDDIEFFFNDQLKLVHVRSASRIGRFDLGVNRRRMKKIRKMFSERNRNERD